MKTEISINKDRGNSINSHFHPFLAIYENQFFTQNPSKPTNSSLMKKIVKHSNILIFPSTSNRLKKDYNNQDIVLCEFYHFSTFQRSVHKQPTEKFIWNSKNIWKRIEKCFGNVFFSVFKMNKCRREQCVSFIKKHIYVKLNKSGKKSWKMNRHHQKKCVFKSFINTDYGTLGCFITLRGLRVCLWDWGNVRSAIKVWKDERLISNLNLKRILSKGTISKRIYCPNFDWTFNFSFPW